MAIKDISDEELMLVEYAFRLLKNFVPLFAGTAAVFGLLVVSPIFPKASHVILTMEDPLMVVDPEGLINGLSSQFGGSDMSVSVISKIEANLEHSWDPSSGYPAARELTAKYRVVFFRERNSVRRRELASPSSEVEIRSRYGNLGWILARAKQSLGYTDKDTQALQVARRGESFHDLSALRSNPKKLYALLVDPRRHFSRPFFPDHGWYGEEFNISYTNDPFYGPLETLDGTNKVPAYVILDQASEMYAWWTLENTGAEDVYDVRITASVNTNELAMDTLDYFGVTVDQIQNDSVRLRVACLAPGSKNYKLIVIRHLPNPERSGPTEVTTLRLDQKPFLEQIGDYWLWILVIPLVLAALATHVAFLRECRARKLLPDEIS